MGTVFSAEDYILHCCKRYSGSQKAYSGRRTADYDGNDMVHALVDTHLTHLCAI